MSTAASPGLEMWAGIECTVNRVGDRFLDQLERNGHARRDDDIDRLAALGIAALRYPVLWERAARLGDEHWRWCDRRLGRLRELGVRPIAGLVHHGSGPIGTSLVDPAFPDRLAEYAHACAQRWPWIDEWTPVNEPLTTARFSGLYGHWYPHGHDDRIFLRCLLTELIATAKAMRAIRAVNPRARLVQTEDLGCTRATPPLAYQAEFENARRWLSLDLLCGRVDRSHPLWDWLEHVAAPFDAIAWLREHPCPPDVIGINHYLTSERWLDHRLHLYPERVHGGNHRERYADVEAVRACEMYGPQALLRQTWERFALPIAVTEAHLHCTREEQLRWLDEIWRGADALRGDGVDIRAVTAWSALGAFDWVSLLTADRGVYEAGMFDLRAPAPRPTAIARHVRHLATGEGSPHPVVAAPGWWRRDVRIEYDIGLDLRHESVPEDVAPLVVTGRGGTLGRAFARLCALRGIPCALTGRDDLDIADEDAARALIARLKPWAVVNAAGFVRVDDAQRDAVRCWRDNRDGAAALARACADADVPLMTFSTDLVFDGTAGHAYVETDATSPLSVYGASKAAAEATVLAAHPGALVVRSAAFFSPWDEHNALTVALRRLAAGQTVHAYADAIVSPTYVPDLVQAALDLLIDGEVGIWHLANRGAVSWLEFVRAAAGLAGYDAERVRPAHRPPHLPRAVPLASGRGEILRPLDDALATWWGIVADELAAGAPSVAVG